MSINSVQVKKKFGDKEVINDFTFEVKKGRVTVLVGPNGVGKSTWINIALALIKPDKGFVRFDELSMEKSRDKIAVVFDDIPMVGYLNGYDNLNLLSGGMQNHKAEILKEMNLTDELMKLKGKAYSFGQRHRIGVAAALMRNPEYLILDEPAVGIDLEGWESLRRLLRKQADKGTCILVTGHNYDLIEEIADDILVIKDGVIFYEGSKQKFLEEGISLKEKYRELYIENKYEKNNEKN